MYNNFNFKKLNIIEEEFNELSDDTKHLQKPFLKNKWTMEGKLANRTL